MMSLDGKHEQGLKLKESILVGLEVVSVLINQNSNYR